MRQHHATRATSRAPRVLTLALAAAIALPAAVGLAGCADDTGGGSGDKAASGGGAFPVTVGTVTLATKPIRIVSLSATVTEILFAIGAGAQVVAVDDQSNYPANAPKTDMSGLKPNAEAIAARNADLVVVNADTNKIVEQLAALKIPTYLAPAATTIDDSYRQITELGQLTGHQTEAAATVQKMKDGIAEIVKNVKPRARKLTYYHELTPDLYSSTSKTFIGSVYALLGLANVADAADTAGGGYPQLNAEALIKANPDLIFLADTKCCQQSAATLKTRSGFADVTAVRTGQVIELDDDVASRWGPRIVDLLRTVADAVAKVPSA